MNKVLECPGTPTSPPQTARQPHPCAALLRAIADGATEFEYSPGWDTWDTNDWVRDDLEGVLIAIAYGADPARYRVKGSASMTTPTQEDVIRWAREAGMALAIGDSRCGYIERFAALVAAAEREACAQMCDARSLGDNNREDAEARRCARAIRARSQS